MIAAIERASGCGARSSSPSRRASASWRMKCSSTSGATVFAAWYVGSVLIILFAGKECVLVDEAEYIAPRIVGVERSLPPWTFDNRAGARAVNVFSRETVQVARALVNRFEIADGEVDVV